MTKHTFCPLKLRLVSRLLLPTTPAIVPITIPVNSIPITKKSTIKYGLALTKDAFEVIPLFTRRIVAIGISKAMPKAKTSLKIYRGLGETG